MEKLSDNSLENVFGGLTCQNMIIFQGTCIYTALATGLGATACTIASTVFNAKASKAIKKCDTTTGAQYNEKAKRLSTIGASLGSAAMTSAAVDIIASAIHDKRNGWGTHNCFNSLH